MIYASGKKEALPSDAPIPTMTTESSALPNVRSAGSRPAENQIADVISMLLPLDNCTTPAPIKTRAWRQAPALAAASRMFAFVEGQTQDCTAESKRLSATAPIPAPSPIRITANQKRVAPG